MDHAYLILLRVFHVAFGVFWAGASIYLAAFVLPAVTALGPEGGKFMQQLVRTHRLPLVMMLVPIVTVLSGILLIWKVSGGLAKDWVASNHGSVLIVGALLALIGFGIAIGVNRPAADRMNLLSQQVAKGGAPPSPAQLQELDQLRGKLTRGIRNIAWLLAFTVIAMSLAHYL